MTSDGGRPLVRLNLPAEPGRPRDRSEPALPRHLRATVARGYRPDDTWTVPVRYLLEDGSSTGDQEKAAAALRGPGEPVFTLVAPTYVRRHTLAEQEERLDRLLERVDEAVREHPGAGFVLFLGMQWSVPEEEKEALRRLEALLSRAGRHRSAVRVAGLSLPGPGKPRTLNAAIAVAETLGCAGVGWLDDDVTLEPACLAHLVGDFLDGGCRGAVGATKIPHAKPQTTSRLLHRAKAVAGPATNYPHGCCILVATDVMAGGMPDRYVSDDGYVCFRLLDPDLPDPLAHLRLVPGARCHYHVAGPAGETRRRIRRLLLNHLVDLADWPLPVTRHYFRHILFPGMWPLTGWSGSKGVAQGVGNAAIKWVYFGWFAAVGAELYLRGLFRRPLRGIRWAPYSTASAPVPADAEPLA
ncbi:hypothetical protein [Streptomyces sp. AK02-01A]|uniref:hypothetical protein n=1 Tax=Streptomyces sp. AK02-01A TaxID=3028648 RepID=UPI0029AA98B8|nr:hypothetical protein [Streptomyces sp. AK02-01A]MDX3852344.1 hypothetical protein [Streptomyces sp. AK02-01A]